MALENCIGMLTDILYEDLEPAAILEMREVKKEQGPAEKQGEEVAVEKEYLVRWGDDIDDTWVCCFGGGCWWYMLGMKRECVVVSMSIQRCLLLTKLLTC